MNTLIQSYLNPDKKQFLGNVTNYAIYKIKTGHYWLKTKNSIKIYIENKKCTSQF